MTGLAQIAERWTRLGTAAWDASVVGFVRSLLGRDPPSDWRDGVESHGLRRPKETIVYLVARTLRPADIVETGVCLGWSSRALLAALHDNGGSGRLHSIDLPIVGKDGQINADGRFDGAHVERTEDTGREVPGYLRDLWTLQLGDSRQLLADLLPTLQLELFFHDSEHTYSAMSWEYNTSWPFLRSGGVLFSDDVNWSSAFVDFAHKVNRRPVSFPAGDDRMGGVLK